MPWSIATVRTVMRRSGKRALFSATVATIAFPSVNAAWGNPRTTTPVTTSSQRSAERAKCGSWNPNESWRSSPRRAGSRTERHGRAEGQQQEHRGDPLSREQHEREGHGDHGEEVVTHHQLDALDDEREAEAEDESLHDGPARERPR
jgi:hypothetical protein